MKVPPKRKGNHASRLPHPNVPGSLNESPSEKEGKFVRATYLLMGDSAPSMKVPPKRKGNAGFVYGW